MKSDGRPSPGEKKVLDLHAINPCLSVGDAAKQLGLSHAMISKTAKMYGLEFSRPHVDIAPGDDPIDTQSGNEADVAVLARSYGGSVIRALADIALNRALTRDTNGKEIYRAANVSASARVAAATELLNRGYGRTSTAEGDKGGNAPPVPIIVQFVSPANANKPSNESPVRVNFGK